MDPNLHDSCVDSPGCCDDRVLCGPVFNHEEAVADVETTTAVGEEIAVDSSDEDPISNRNKLNHPETAGKVAIAGAHNFLPKLSGPNFPITKPKKWF